jgi:hypothetical protein
MNGDFNNGNDTESSSALGQPKPLKSDLLHKKKAAFLKLKIQHAKQKKASLERARRQALVPVNALLKAGNDSLLIRSIDLTNEKVRFRKIASDTNAAPYDGGIDLDEDLAAPACESSNLLKRKREIESKLIHAKAKRLRLEQQQQPFLDTLDGTKETDLPPLRATREELLKRRKEVEKSKAVTHVNYLVAKLDHQKLEQEQMLIETDSQLNETKLDIETSQKRLDEIDRNAATLTVRQLIVQNQISQYVAKLVEARRKLHEYRVAKQQPAHLAID